MLSHARDSTVINSLGWLFVSVTNSLCVALIVGETEVMQWHTKMHMMRPEIPLPPLIFALTAIAR